MVLDSLKLKKAQDQAQRIDGLDAMKEALLETTTTNTSNHSTTAAAITTAPRNLLRTNRGRQALMAQEVEQLNLVWQHPAYQADPLATLREHLLQSVAAATAAAAATANKKDNNETITSKPSQHRKRHKTSKYRATRSRKR